MGTYKYRPILFYVIVFIVTWLFWFAAAIVGHSGANNGIMMFFMPEYNPFDDIARRGGLEHRAHPVNSFDKLFKVDFPLRHRLMPPDSLFCWLKYGGDG